MPSLQEEFLFIILILIIFYNKKIMRIIRVIFKILLKKADKNNDFNKNKEKNKHNQERFQQENQQKDPYEILGVSRNDSFEYIKKVYKEKIRKFHPDLIQSKDLDKDFIEFAKRKTQELNEAFEEMKLRKQKKRP